MLYLLDLGSNEQSIAKQAIRTGQALPDRIANAPRIKLGLAFYLQAFFDLDADRSQGMGMGRIPWSSVMRYADYYQLDEDQTERLVHYTRVMDTAVLQRATAERK